MEPSSHPVTHPRPPKGPVPKVPAFQFEIPHGNHTFDTFFTARGGISVAVATSQGVRHMCQTQTELSPALSNGTVKLGPPPTPQHRPAPVGGTSLCWWANVVGRWQDAEALGELLDLLFGPEGLRLTVVRYNLGAGSDDGRHPGRAHCVASGLRRVPRWSGGGAGAFWSPRPRTGTEWNPTRSR